MTAAEDRARLDQIHKHECTRLEVRARTIRGGSIQHVRQCLECGEAVGGPLKQSGSPPVFDEQLLSEWAEERRTLAKELQSSKETAWWEAYKAYLGSDKWKQMRSLVLMRDQYKCQGCLSATATEVHHLTYDHAMNEFAFELTSLCEACHERIHAEAPK